MTPSSTSIKQSLQVGRKPIGSFIANSKAALAHTSRHDIAGDVLVFLTGSEEVDDTVELIRQRAAEYVLGGSHSCAATNSGSLLTVLHVRRPFASFRIRPGDLKPGSPRSLSVLPIYSGLPGAQQMKVAQHSSYGHSQYVSLCFGNSPLHSIASGVPNYAQACAKGNRGDQHRRNLDHNRWRSLRCRFRVRQGASIQPPSKQGSRLLTPVCVYLARGSRSKRTTRPRQWKRWWWSRSPRPEPISEQVAPDGNGPANATVFTPRCSLPASQFSVACVRLNGLWRCVCASTGGLSRHASQHHP